MGTAEKGGGGQGRQSGEKGVCTVTEGGTDAWSLSSLAGGGGQDSWPCTQRWRPQRAAEGTERAQE